MRAVSDFFLRAKHWQLFLAFVGLSCGTAGAMLITLLSFPQEALKKMFPFFAVMELLAILFALWIWSLGVFLNSVVPSNLRMKESFFRIAAVFIPLYLPVFGVFFQNTDHVRNVTLILISFAIIVPLHLFAMFCQVYIWYFVSKSMAVAENQRPASFPDYVGYFFGLWLFPVGVWLIQPRINRLYVNAVSI